MFRENIEAEKNRDGIPQAIVEELTPLQYEICSLYQRSIRRGESVLRETAPISDSSHYRTVCYNEKVKELNEYVNIKEKLVLKERLLWDRIQEVAPSQVVTKGITIFMLVAVFNIFLPLLFMLFNPTTNVAWYWTETVVSLLLFFLGTLSMIKYISSLFPRNEEIVEHDEKGERNE